VTATTDEGSAMLGRLGTRRAATLAAVALVAASTTACDDAVAPPPPDPLSVEVPTVPAAQGPLSDEGAWWAAGVLHVGGRSEELGQLTSFALADRTVAFLDAESRLCFTDLVAAECSSLTAYGDPVVSPDGRHLGFLESSRGRRDTFGQPRLTTVVLDLDSGEVLLATATGMGDPAEDDLGALYSDAEPSFVGFTAQGEAIVQPASSPTGGSPLLLPLYDPEDPEASSPEDEDLVTAGRDDLALRDLPGETVRLELGTPELVPREGAVKSSDEEGQVSPDGEAVITGPIGARTGLVAAPPGGLGQRFTGQQETWWAFGAWAGPHDFLATTLDPAQTTYRVYRCDAVARTCVLADQVPTGRRSIDAVLFPTTAGSDASTISSP